MLSPASAAQVFVFGNLVNRRRKRDDVAFMFVLSLLEPAERRLNDTAKLNFIPCAEISVSPVDSVSFNADNFAAENPRCRPTIIPSIIQHHLSRTLDVNFTRAPAKVARAANVANFDIFS